MKGFQSPNHTQVPNDLFDEHLADLGHAELKVLMVLIRWTLGFHRRKIRMPLRKMEELTGLSRRSIITAAKKLIGRGLVEQDTERVSEWRIAWRDGDQDPPHVGVESGELTSPVDSSSGSLTSPPDDEVVQKGNRSGSVTSPPSVKETEKESKSSERKERGSLDQTPWVMALALVKQSVFKGSDPEWDASPWAHTWLARNRSGVMVIGCEKEIDYVALRGQASLAADYLLEATGQKFLVEFAGPEQLERIPHDG